MAARTDTTKGVFDKVDGGIGISYEEYRKAEPVTGSTALAEALADAKPRPLSKNMIKLYGIMVVGYLIATMNGFDSILMGAINAMPAYQKTFALTGAGSSTGIIFIIYNLPGRGRFLLGFGAAIASAAGPAYIAELAHPAFRGIMAGFYNNFWWFGNIIAGWTTYGSNKNLTTSSWAWRTPTVVQAGMPLIVIVLIILFPESPRWLVAHDRNEEAIKILAKYHADGDEHAPIVRLQYEEIREDLAETADKTAWWDYRGLANTRGRRYRLSMVIAMAFFGQWSGNNVVSYFMTEILKSAGILDPNKQLLINAIAPIFALIASAYGATLLDKRGRRFMLLWGMVGSIFAFILLTAFVSKTDAVPGLAYGTIVAIYLFLIFFSWGWTPLQMLYPVECLENVSRAKGMGVNYLFLNIAMVVNTFGVSVAIEKIGWRLYLIYICWQVVELVTLYFFFPETAGRSIEELSEVFNDPHPVKASLKSPLTKTHSSGS
ncbi:hypothetical protein WHR41_01848 [Cladosporium halotolerans]|uniref:Major facilitator superfamily (MFS) profile domain-containing protein n=1 Tax=Cladosporium halotolerans TaxID=1052096 RepID=A0AB34KZV9_9PEZI